ncbi:MAG: hypothetical protein PHQ40_20925 [Anaerolineaceae bacterium]|nr:hypothetical protein [Anaerolineaceae bacterium]
MAQTPVSHNPTQNHDPQKDGVSGDDITHLQGQLYIPERPPKSLLDWLVRVHLRLIALEDEYKDTS